MKLEEFVNEAKSELEWFEKWWREQQRGPGGNLFPDNMDFPEWLEQFNFWADSERNGPQT